MGTRPYSKSPNKDGIGRNPILTRREAGFIKDYLATRNGTLSAKRNYRPKSDRNASAMASGLLKRPIVQKALQDALGDLNLTEKHDQLMNAAVLEKISFEQDASDAEIENIIKELPGYKLFKIIDTYAWQKKVRVVSGRVAYVRAPDSNTQDKALDKAYKIKGRYAPEKSLNINVELKPTDPKALALAEEYEQKLKTGL